MSETNNNYLNESGLSRFWNEKVKALIFKKATLQEDLVIKNPRVSVDVEDGFTFPKGYKMEQIFNYLYHRVYDEANPNIPLTRPTVDLKITIQKEAELYDTVEYTVEKNSFNPGTIGTCVEPWKKEPNQSTMPSGSTEITGSFKIYSGDTNDPEQCDTEETLVDDKAIRTVIVENVGVNNIGKYYCGTVEYTESKAVAKTSYGNDVYPAVPDVTYFGEGETEKSMCVTKSITGYKPAFGNISLTPTEEIKTTILNLGNKFNKTGEFEFYYGKTNTSEVGTQSNFLIFFPAELNASVKYWDTITQKWETVNTVIENEYFADLPAKDDQTKYPGIADSGVSYKLIKQANGFAYGPRKYKITLS